MQIVLPIARALLLLGPTALAFASGGYFTHAQLIAGLCVWVLVLFTVIFSDAPLPRSTSGRIALASFGLLTLWTGLSILWAPLGGPAIHDTQRLLLYLGTFIAATALLRTAKIWRAVEPILACGILVVISYGLAGRFLPDLIHLTSTTSAGGRLEQPLTYWNSEGALAAMGIVLFTHLLIDKTRDQVLRIAAAVALIPLGLGLYLTFSRGALGALAIGLIVLILLARTSPSFQTVKLSIGVTVAIFGVIALFVLATTEQGPRISSPTFGADASRLRSVHTNRYAYWKVALGAFAEHPIQGLGAGGFRVRWLAERPFREPVKDAHSLYVETLTELGIVGFALLLTFLLSLLACARRVWRSNPTLVSGWCAALVVFVTHAALDWDFELPAITLVAIVLSGALIACSEEQSTIEKSQVDKETVAILTTD